MPDANAVAATCSAVSAAATAETGTLGSWAAAATATAVAPNAAPVIVTPLTTTAVAATCTLETLSGSVDVGLVSVATKGASATAVAPFPAVTITGGTRDEPEAPDQTETKLDRSALEVLVTYAGLRVVTSDDYTHRYGARQTNYYLCPWTLSTPGRGRLLMTSEDAETLKGKKANDGYDLVLQVGAETVTLKNIYWIKMRPLMTFQEEAVLADTPADQPGLWEIEIGDKRLVHLMHYGSNAFNVLDPSSGEFYESTQRLHLGDDEEDPEDDFYLPYTYLEAVEKVLNDLGFLPEEPDFELPILPNAKPENIAYREIPLAMQVDFLLHEVGLVVKHDPRVDSENDYIWPDEDEATPYSIEKVHDEEYLTVLREANLFRRISGGSSILNRAMLLPETWRVVSPPEGSMDFSEEWPSVEIASDVATPAPGTDVALHNSRLIKSADTPDSMIAGEIAYHANTRVPAASINETYSGFIGGFLGAGALDTVAFYWNETPQTVIRMEAIRPLTTLMRNRRESLVKGEPCLVAHYQSGVATFSMSESGWIVSQLSGGGGGSIQLLYKSMGPDHLVCHSWDGVTEGEEDILVAKPFLLRRTPFDGLTRNGIAYTYSDDHQREAAAGDTTEPQVIVSPYVPGDIIYAAELAGGAHVIAYDASFPDGKKSLTLVDTDEGRSWARISTMVPSGYNIGTTVATVKAVAPDATVETTP